MNDKEMVRRSISSVKSNFCESPLNSTDCYLLTFYLAGIWEKLCIHSRNKELRSESLEISGRKNRRGKTNAFKNQKLLLQLVLEKLQKLPIMKVLRNMGHMRGSVRDGPGDGLLLAPHCQSNRIGLQREQGTSASTSEQYTKCYIPESQV